VLGAGALLAAHESARPVVLGRYSPAFAALLALYALGTVALFWIVTGPERAYRALFNVNALVAVVAFAAALGASELLARAVLRARVRTFPKSVIARTVTAEYDVEMATNSEGFRDDEHARAKPEGTVRIAVLGDSFVVGSGVARYSIFTSLLPAQLAQLVGGTPIGISPSKAAAAETPRRVEVQNFGVSGTGPVATERIFRRYAARYEPDLVLVCVYAGNDASDALRERAEVRPALATATLAVEALGRLRALLRADRRGAAPTPGAGGWNAFGGENPASLPALLAAARRRGVPADSVRARLAALPDSLLADALAFRSNPYNLAEAVLDPSSLRDNVLVATPQLAEGWNHLEAALSALDEEVRRSSARMVLAVIPAGVQVDKKYWWAARLGFALDDRVLSEPVFQDRLRGFALGAGIPFIDLLPEMKSLGSSSLYFEQDGHWNASGHEAAARAIANGLRAETTALFGD
jgi:lysophospholipase L1-like esterase